MDWKRPETPDTLHEADSAWGHGSVLQHRTPRRALAGRARDRDAMGEWRGARESAAGAWQRRRRGARTARSAGRRHAPPPPNTCKNGSGLGGGEVEPCAETQGGPSVRLRERSPRAQAGAKGQRAPRLLGLRPRRTASRAPARAARSTLLPSRSAKAVFRRRTAPPTTSGDMCDCSQTHPAAKRHAGAHSQARSSENLSHAALRTLPEQTFGPTPQEPRREPCQTRPKGAAARRGAKWQSTRHCLDSPSPSTTPL